MSLIVPNTAGSTDPGCAIINIELNREVKGDLLHVNVWLC